MSGERIAFIPSAEPLVGRIPMAPIIVQDTLPVFVSNHEGSEWIQLESGPFPGREWYFFERRGRLVPGSYGERLEYVAGDSVLYVAPTRSTVIKKFSASTGQIIGSIELPVEPRALSSADRDFIHASIIQNDREEAFDEMPLSPLVPAISDLRVSDSGNLWVQLFQAPIDSVANWLVYSPAGGLIGSLSVDRGIRLMDVGEDYVVASVTDSLGRDAVRLYQLILPN
jgi:hypothetical protein